MIDLHTHILHEIDDGSRSLAAAVELARAAIADGITTLAATPHGRSSVNVGSRYSVERLRARLAELRAALAAAGLALTIVPGTEIYGEPGVADRLRRGELLTYGETRTALVEFPAHISPAGLGAVLDELAAANYRVVLAHPERIRFVQDDPQALRPLIAAGAQMQLTADALVGAQGEWMQALAEQLLRLGLIQVIASDSHGPHFDRMPNLGAAHARAAQILGGAAARALVYDTPLAIIGA